MIRAFETTVLIVVDDRGMDNRPSMNDIKEHLDKLVGDGIPVETNPVGLEAIQINVKELQELSVYDTNRIIGIDQDDPELD